jgi:L-alanine-DL-glutamate epimerase-like enolase superfamily enzyme
VSRIVRVEVGRYDYAFAGAFKFFKPGKDGVVRRPSMFVRLTDEAGFQGWGQAVPVPTWTYETVETVESTLTNYLADAVLGADPGDLAEVHQRMDYAIRPGFSTGQPIAKAALDLACYDLVGKRGGVPVANLLGGARRDAIRLNWTLNAPTLAEAEIQLEKARIAGFGHFNIKVGPPQTPEYDLELVRLVRREFPDTFLWVDANTGYCLETALDMLPKFAAMGVQAIESPLPPNQLRGYQALKKNGAVPIYMDEGIISPVETAEFITLEMFDGVTLKHSRSGGLWQAQQIICLVKEAGLQLLGSGLTDPDLSLAAALHLYAWADIDRPCALNGPQFIGETLVKDGYRIQGDLIYLPTGPGLGIELDEKAQSVLRFAVEA